LSNPKSELLALLREKAVLHGDFTLASGQKSTYYIDGRLVTLDAEGARLIGALLAPMLSERGIDAVGGPTMGADPIIGAVIAESARIGKPVTGFLVRKEAKAHGRGKQIEGPSVEGKRVALVDDVISTGGSLLRAADAVVAAGAFVDCVAAIVDREMGAEDAFAERGLPYLPLYKKGELL
jgi:orotate phosphoribosyltransferase